MDRGRLGMRWWAASHLPPSGGGSYRKMFIVLEPVGARSTDIFIYIIICMYVCMYQGRSEQGRVKSFRFKVRSHRIAPRSGCKHDDGNDDDSDDDSDDDDYDGGDDDGDVDDVPPTTLLFCLYDRTEFEDTRC